ncbi:MAG: hypothetical protein ACRC5M_02865 [Anaeroplasmataceae bacterium]
MSDCEEFYSNLNYYLKTNTQDKDLRFKVVDFLIINFTDNVYTNALRDRLVKRVLVVNGDKIIYRELLIYSDYVKPTSNNLLIELLPCGQYAFSDDCKYFRLSIDKYGSIYFNRELCYFSYNSDGYLCLYTVGRFDR